MREDDTMKTSVIKSGFKQQQQQEEEELQGKKTMPSQRQRQVDKSRRKDGLKRTGKDLIHKNLALNFLVSLSSSSRVIETLVGSPE